jgi:Fic family protein
MRIPPTPPDFQKAWTKLFQDQSKLNKLGELMSSLPEGYEHWDKIRFFKAAPPFTPTDAWIAVKWSRALQQLPFLDTRGAPLVYSQPNNFSRTLHEIDSSARGMIGIPGRAATSEGRDIYLQKSLVEEPFASSVLEGAATTREIAKRMIEEGRAPRTVDERMVLNNFRAMEFIREHGREPLTVERILEVHRILTEGTLEKPEKCGVFRSASDDVRVVDAVTDETLHIPPPAKELKGRMEKLCDFANAPSESGRFLHPIIRAIIIHFVLAYDHPFWDGNGRCARALFYWCVLRHGYWLLEFISISSVIRKAPLKYGTAFLYAETDGGDVTYFIDHQLGVIVRACRDLQVYLEEKSKELTALQNALGRLAAVFNTRQLQLIQDAIKRPNARYEIATHQALNRVSYLTARADLEDMAKHGFLKKTKEGTKSIFLVPKNLKDRIT